MKEFEKQQLFSSVRRALEGLTIAELKQLCKINNWQGYPISPKWELEEFVAKKLTQKQS